MRLKMSADSGTRTTSPSLLSSDSNACLTLCYCGLGGPAPRRVGIRDGRAARLSYDERPGPAGAPVSFQIFSQFQSPDVNCVGNGTPS
jgi:hypothetical protein